MGGGGAMRAAVKAAGVGIQNVGIRGLPENFVNRKPVRLSASVLSSPTIADDSRKLEISASSQPASAIAWELDDWELAGFDAEEKPRLVFGPAPSLDETKSAANELRDALDILYFSPSKPAGSFHSEERSVVLECDQNSVVSPVPKHALQAFKLFKENSAAQNVVAAIASDPNVWKAVLENETLNEFMQSETKYVGKEVEEQVEPLNSSAESSAENTGSFFTEFAENVKVTVAGWVDNMSSFFQELFGDKDGKSSTEADNWSPSSNSVYGSLFALASMVIMVVVLKRA